MAFIVGSIPYIYGFIRREYTTGFKSGWGDFLRCKIFGVRVLRGVSIEFQSVIEDEREGAGAMFLAPIEAFVCESTAEANPEGFNAWRERPNMTYIQPWDCFASEFGVHQFDLMKQMRCLVLPDRLHGRYHCTLDFIGTDLAEDSLQHKHLHIVRLDNGLIGAFPNNRLLMVDPAQWDVCTERPHFEALGGEFRGE